MKISGIYKIQSIINPKKIYIGSAVNIYDRWRHHSSDLRLNKHGNKILQNHYNKYGISDLQYSILLSCEKEDLLKIEQYFIDSYNPSFNINPKAGSRLGSKHSIEARKKMSERMKGSKLHKGFTHSDETKKIMATKKLGHIPWNKGGGEYTDEMRLKMSIAKKGKPSPMKGKTHSTESRLKMSKYMTGRKRGYYKIKNKEAV